MQTKNSTLLSALNFILYRCSNILIAALFVFLISSGQKSYGQICTGGTPSDTFNLTGHPDTTFNTAVIARGGGCCGNSNCADLYITLDANTAALSISVNGASANGSFTMNIDCSNQPYSVGDLICLSGGGSHDITICKPGSNAYSFAVTASSAPTFPSSSTTRIGCSSVMNVGGLVESGITWQSVSPGTPGEYNSYLSCTSGCSSSVFTPLAGAPDSIDYQICGNVTASACTGISQVCQTVRMYVEPGVTVVVNLPTVTLNCLNPIATINAAAAAGTTLLWSPGGATTSSISVSSANTYTVTATSDAYGCTTAAATATSVVSADFSTPNLNCGAGINLTCANPSGTIGVTAVSGVTFVWSGPGIVGSNSGSSINVDAQGTYSVVATKTSSGCTQNCSILVGQDLSVCSISCPEAIHLTCNNPSQQVSQGSASSGCTYQLRTGTTFFSLPHTYSQTLSGGDADGTYWIIGTSTSSGCQDSCSFTMDRNFTICPLTCPNPIHLTCNNPSQQVSQTSSGCTFQLRTGATFLSLPHTFNQTIAGGDADGTYWIIGTNTASGCMDSCSFTIDRNFTVCPITCPNPIHLTCNNPSVQVSQSSSGCTFQLRTGSTFFSLPHTFNQTVVGGDANGTYWIIGTNTASGCKDSCSFTMDRNFTVCQLTCPNAIHLTCNNPSQQVNQTSSACTFKLRTGSTFISLPHTFSQTVIGGDADGTYWITGTNTATGCMDSCSFTIDRNFTQSPAHAGPDNAISCITPQVNLSANPIPPGVSYSWNAINGGHIVSGGSTATPLVNAAGCYVLTATYIASGCTSRDTACVTGNTIHPNCNIIAPVTVPDSNTAGYTLTSNSTNTNTWQWSVSTLPSNNPWIITSATNGSSIAYTSGTGVAVFKLVVVNTTNGCVDSCTLAIGVNGTKFCMYGQGAYGNAGGKYCDNLSTTQLMTNLLSTPLALGGGNNSITFYQSDVSCIISRLPGGGGFSKLNGIATCTNPVGIQLFPHNGRFRNGLLSQTITYGLNLRICNIGNIVIAGPYMVTYGSNEGNCCVNGGISQGSASTTVIPLDVWNYLKTTLGRNPTFLDVFNLANQALAGTYVPSGHTNPGLPDIAGAEDAISSAFDGCRVLAGFSTTPLRLEDAGETSTDGNIYDMSIKVFPNPFSNQTTIEMKPDADYDNVSVELYNITGAKVSVLYHGAAASGITYSWVVDGTSLSDGIYMYRIIADDDIYNGKIILIR